MCMPIARTPYRRDLTIIPNCIRIRTVHKKPVLCTPTSVFRHLVNVHVSDIAMLRLTLARSAALARIASHARVSIVAPRVALQQIRYESSKTPEERKKMLDQRADLQRDWDAKVITYEELKPKTLQPSPVSSLVSRVICSA